MRQVHLAGEKLFVDFAGRTAEVIDGLTGQIIPVQIFVAVMGASSLTYAEAVWSQKLPDSLRGLRGRSSGDLTGPSILIQPAFTSAARIAATITPRALTARRKSDHDHRNG